MTEQPDDFIGTRWRNRISGHIYRAVRPARYPGMYRMENEGGGQTKMQSRRYLETTDDFEQLPRRSNDD